MKTTNLGENKIVFYNNFESLPIKRYQRFNKYLMISNEVGSDFNDYDKRMMRTNEFLNKKMYDDALKELTNMRQMVWNAYTEYSPNGMALAILVHSINGQVYTDYSDDGLQEVLDKLDEIGYGKDKGVETISEVKKKSIWNWFNTFRTNLTQR